MTGFTIHDDPGITPGTHALVIGVGTYPHLAGGEKPVADPDGMRQLSSPPVSARAFATWLRADYHHPRKPLASLALLLSEETPAPFTDPETGTDHAVAFAGIANIVEAVKEWKGRGESHEDNRLVFYFCGHGVSQGDDMSLLAADVFADEDNPLGGALDFKNLMNGLKNCRAGQQVFFVDACRASSDVLIEQSGGFAGLVPLRPGSRPANLPRRLHVPYYATLAGDRSHARPGQVSLFTQALLKGLGGVGSDDPEGDWRVTTAGLHVAIDHYMKQPVFAAALTGVQVPTVGELPVFDLHELRGLPVVPVYVTCVPPEQNAIADFTCRRAGQEHLRRAAAEAGDEHPDGEWAIDLVSGDYEFEARLGAQDVRKLTRAVRPPYRRVPLAAPAEAVPP
ncbi:caspase family protein [Streptomyces sp. NPDC054841]